MKNHKKSDLRRLAVVLQDSNDAITVQGLDGTILSWNKGAENMYGYSEKEALGMKISQIVPKDKQKGVFDYLEKIRFGHKIESFETQRITKEGMVLDVWLIITCLKDDSGVIDSIATTERDITEIKNEIRKKENEVKILRGLLPICSSCKEIRDDKGYWHQIERYIEDHSEVLFSHSICPKCEKKLYGDQDWYKKRKLKKE